MCIYTKPKHKQPGHDDLYSQIYGHISICHIQGFLFILS